MSQLRFNLDLNQIDLYVRFPAIQATIDQIDLNMYIALFGIEPVIKLAVDIILPMLPTYKLGYQFSMEELDFASIVENENKFASDFIKDSGITRSEYGNATSNSIPEIDRPGGPQQILHAMCVAMYDKQISSQFRTEVAKKIMQHFKIGNF